MKKNNGILITILCSAVFCFICLGVVFLFPNSSKTMKGNNIVPNQSISVDDEEVSLGDCTPGYTDWQPGSWTNWYSGTPSCNSCTYAPDDSTTGSSYNQYEVSGPIDSCTNAPCTRYRTWTRVWKACTCTTSQYVVSTASGDGCKDCPSGYSTTSSDNASKSRCYKTIPGGKYAVWTETTGHIETACAAGTIMSLPYKAYWGQNYSCEKCDKGYYQNSTGQRACMPCQKGYYADQKGSIACTKCPDGETTLGTGSTSKNECYKVGGSCQYTSQSNCESTTSKTCYENGGGCWVPMDDEPTVTCPEGYTPDAGATNTSQCYMIVPAGKYAVFSSASASHIIDNCKSNTYSTRRKVYYGRTSYCTACDEGKTSGEGASSCTAIKISRIEISNLNQNTLYLNPAEAFGHGFYTVKYVAYDTNNNKINGANVTWNVSNTNVVVSKSASPNGYDVTYKGLGCDTYNPKVYVTATYNGTKVTSDSITIYAQHRVWSLTGEGTGAGGFEKGSAILLSEGEIKSSCIAVSDPYTYEGKTLYHKKYSRCCGSTGGDKYDFCCVNGNTYTWYEGQNSKTCPSGKGTINTKITTKSACKKIDEQVPHCYEDEKGNYIWSSNPEKAWKLLSNITKEANCKKEEEKDACYLTKDNKYVWGKYALKDGYTLVTSMKTENACKAPTSSDACYVSADGETYVWASTKPDGYTKVTAITRPEDCTKAETPACYLHGTKYVWGKYEKVSGYIQIPTITGDKDCKAPGNEACYIDKTGKYVWGSYGSDANYKLVTTITDSTKCNNTVPVPKTDVDVPKIIYIAMAILMAVGIGFIYYATTSKKND